MYLFIVKYFTIHNFTFLKKYYFLYYIFLSVFLKVNIHLNIEKYTYLFKVFPYLVNKAQQIMGLMSIKEIKQDKKKCNKV